MVINTITTACKPYVDAAFMVEYAPPVPTLQLFVEQHLQAIPVPATNVPAGHVDEGKHEYTVLTCEFSPYVEAVFIDKIRK